jgi:antitoxin FitA
VASLTIRNLNDEIKRQLRIRGALNNRSMEAEARAILEKALSISETSRGLGRMIQDIVRPVGGVDLFTPDRKNDPSDDRLPDFRGE